jgi:hypothetical protein
MLFFMLEDHVDARGSVGAHLSREREVQSYRTRDSAGAHLRREARSEAIGHVATSESTSA